MEHQGAAPRNGVNVDGGPVPPGIERERLEPWLAANVEGLEPPVSYRLIAGGRSNLTYELRDRTGTSFILRRPPLGHVLESAHDVGREHRIISALVTSPVPVAVPLAHCEDASVTGAPFYVMQFVEGPVVRSRTDADQLLTTTSRATAACSLVQTLVALHRLDPDEIGLGDLGPRENYVQRQLRRWHRQFHNATDRVLPVIDEVHDRLTRSIPPQRRTAIVHGDFRIDNCVLGQDGQVRAVLDWELCTLGDPLADVGLLMLYWAQDGDPPDNFRTGTATAAPGFPGRAEVAEMYARLSGCDVSELDFFVSLGYWKLACIYEGIRARYGAGVMADKAIPQTALDGYVQWLAEQALRRLQSAA